MEYQLEQARAFQEHVMQMFQNDLLNKVNSYYLSMAGIVILCSIISYRLGRKKQNNNLLSDKLKKKLDELEQGSQQFVSKLESYKKTLRQSNKFAILIEILLTSFIAYESILNDYKDIKVLIAGGCMVIFFIIWLLHKKFLLNRIVQLSKKIQEDKDQQQVIMQNLLSEMSDKMKKILSEIVSQSVIKENEIEKDIMKRQLDARLKLAKEEIQMEKEILNKQYELKLSLAIQQLEQSQQLEQQFQRTKQQKMGSCKTGLCSKKRKLLKEKLKRNEWFIRNLSEFAWCQVCASNMFEEGNFQEDNLSEPSINLDDSIMQNSLLGNDESDDQDNKQQLFQKLKEQQSESRGEAKDCENNCLSKYFFLCKKIGDKYNQWTEIISNFEDKYKQEKKRVAKSPTSVAAQGTDKEEKKGKELIS